MLLMVSLEKPDAGALLPGRPATRLAHVGVQTGCTKCWKWFLNIELDFVFHHLLYVPAV